MLGIVVDASTNGISDKTNSIANNIGTTALVQENTDLKAKLEEINGTLNPV